MTGNKHIKISLESPFTFTFGVLFDTFTRMARLHPDTPRLLSITHTGQRVSFRIFLFMLATVFLVVETSACQFPLTATLETSEERAPETKEDILLREDKLVLIAKPVLVQPPPYTPTSTRWIVRNTNTILPRTFSRTILYCTYLI